MSEKIKGIYGSLEHPEMVKDWLLTQGMRNEFKSWNFSCESSIYCVHEGGLKVVSDTFRWLFDIVELRKLGPRPYATRKEFMEAEKKHGPWLLRDCDHSVAYRALHVSDQAVSFLNYHKSFEDLFDDFEWQDGTFCGVMEGGEK